MHISVTISITISITNFCIVEHGLPISITISITIFCTVEHPFKERVSVQCCFRCQSIANRLFPIRLPLRPSSYLSTFWKYLMCNFSDLELGQFKVIQGVTALIECGVCEPSNYTGFYIKCNLLRNKEK